VGNSNNEKIYRSYLAEAKWDNLVCESSIKMGAAINKAAAQGLDVISYDPKSIPAIAYMNLADEVTSWTK
jgi:cellulose biosynthesis protein BcsQ